jgi:TPR repeat protein
LNGIGVEKDTEEAKHWFTRAAKEGQNRRAMYNLGVICDNSTDTNKLQEAFQWFKQSAELGDALGCRELANCYYAGWGVETNVYSYRYWRFKAAALGATQAQWLMGDAYRTGDGVPLDRQNSLNWYRKAAAKNHPEALYDLALCYVQDKTNPASMKLSIEYMAAAAKMGHREAQLQCGLLSFRGDVVARDVDAGKYWLTLAATNGWGRAEFMLFQLYYGGRAPAPDCPAFPLDKSEAAKWLRLAAENKNLQAEALLGVMLLRGQDLEKDPVAGEKWLRDAAMHGYATAENDLGYAMLRGDINTTNMIEAAMWFQLAGINATGPDAFQRSQVNLGNAMAQLTDDQQTEMRERVKNFQMIPVAAEDPKITNWERNPAYQPEDGRGGH